MVYLGFHLFHTFFAHYIHMRGIALNVLTLALVGMKLCMLQHNSAIFLYNGDLFMLQYNPFFFSWEHNPGRRYSC